MSEGAWAGFGFIMASAIWFGLFSVSFRNWYNRNEALKAIVFALEETITHLEEGQTRPRYELAADGIDPVVRRRRPLAEQEALRSSPEAADGTIDLTWAADDGS